MLYKVEVAESLGAALLGLLPDSLKILRPVLRVQQIRFGLRRTLLIRVVHEVLDPKQDL